MVQGAQTDFNVKFQRDTLALQILWQLPGYSNLAIPISIACTPQGELNALNHTTHKASSILSVKYP